MGKVERGRGGKRGPTGGCNRIGNDAPREEKKERVEKQSLSIGAAFCLSGLVLVFDLRYILKGRETQTYTSLHLQIQSCLQWKGRAFFSSTGVSINAP